MSKARDYTSMDAQNFKEAGLNPPTILEYDQLDCEGSFIEKIMNQIYGGSEKSWVSYLRGLKKQIHLVDEILATGGSGEGETITIPKVYGSKCP